MPETLRTFIAIELSSEIQEKVGEFANSLRNPQDKITWVSTKNVHITLKFLGDVPANDIVSIQNIISEVAKGHKSLNASIKGTGVFPSERNPRVLWVGVDNGKEEIKNVFTDLENKLASIGISKEERGFTAHLTIGRIKYVKDINEFAQNISKHKEDLFGNFLVDGISLVKSTLTPKGSVYETLFKVKLGG